MKISQEANLRNLKQINDVQKRWKEIEEITKQSLQLPVESPTTQSFTSSTYKTGDGDNIQPVRPGGLDHKKFPSKGLLSDVPNNRTNHE